MTNARIALNALGKEPLIVSTTVELVPSDYFDRLVERLDHSLGLVLASNYEYPSRYSLWNFGFSDPLIIFEARRGGFRLKASSVRGLGLLRYLHDVLSVNADFELSVLDGLCLDGALNPERVANREFSEENRTRKLSVFSVVRSIWQALAHPELKEFGLYGAFGYDLIFEFEDIEQIQERDLSQRDMVLFIPDRIFKNSVAADTGTVTSFEFEYQEHNSASYQRVRSCAPFRCDQSLSPEISCDHAEGEYEKTIARAREEFIKGNLFEAVPGQSFFAGMRSSPAEVFFRMMRSNPSPYAFLMNLDEGEFLIGASPEMYVRSSGRQIETCPISGTIGRGSDPLEDSAQILKLLSSRKDEAELTMCTDVDRNDKARICVPGSVEVRGRRQIEIYSRLIHTVDHVVGELAEGYDALDAFISHMWTVTVTGAPKIWAVKFLEQNELSPRRWYAGAIGGLRADGSINTALSIRMVQVRHGLAEMRAGATALYYSDPAAEERETRIKASAFLAALSGEQNQPGTGQSRSKSDYCRRDLKILLVDHEDSFVNMLGSMFRIFEPKLTTYRSSLALSKLDASVGLMVLSPGPGRPCHFDMSAIIARALELHVPIFGVCLGLQGVVEFFGGKLALLDEPCHGVSTRITHNGDGIFKGLAQNMEVARYHSLFALEDSLPEALTVTARSEDGVIMGVSHRHLPIHTVQFHPESLITSKRDFGKLLIRNILEHGLSDLSL